MDIFAKRPDGVGTDYIAADIWSKFLPEALVEGVLLPKPEAKVLAGGLDKIQEGLNLQKEGVSAQKIVIEIDGSI